MLVLPIIAEAQQELTRPRMNPRVPDVGTNNLLPNSSFECGEFGWSSIGRRTAWGGDLCGLYGEIDAAQAYDGHHSLKVELGPGKTPVTHFDGWPADRVVQAAPLAGNIGWLDAKVGEVMTLSVFMKASRPDVQARLAFFFGPDPRVSAYDLATESALVVVDEAWKRYEFTFAATSPDVFIAVGPDLTGSPDAAATLWIDAVQVEWNDHATEYAPRQPIELGYQSRHFANVYPAGEPVVLDFTGRSTRGAATIPVTVTLEDYFGRPLEQTKAAIAVDAEGSGHAPIELPVDAPGFYRGTVAWNIGDHELSETIRLVSLPPFNHRNSVLGVNHAPPTDDLCRMLAKAGILWVRDCSFGWDQLEPVEGQLDFTSSDHQVDRVLASGLKVMALLPAFASAAWASEAPADLEAHLPDPPPFPPQWARMGYAPRDPETLYRFIDAAVRHFKDRVHVWEFYNEPLLITALPSKEHYDLPGADYTTEDYVRLLSGAYRAMKAADPDCLVLGGMQGPPMHQAAPFVQSDGLEFVDMYTIHPYGYHFHPEDFIQPMEELLTTMDASPQGRRPMWLTECGYYADDDKPWSPYVAPPGHWSADKLLRDERQAADYFIRYAIVMLAHGAQKIFLHQAIEGALNNGNATLDCPLWTQQGAPQKLYAAAAALAGIMGPDPRFAAQVRREDAGRGLYAYAFDSGNTGIVAAWAAPQENAAPWGVRIPADARACNVVGAWEERESVELGESPVYIVSDTLDAEALAAALAFGG